MVGYRAGSDSGRIDWRPALASVRGYLTAAWHAFRVWRRTRPFWGGLLIMVGAGEMLASQQAPLPVLNQVGIRGLAAYLTPMFMLLCGVLVWFSSIGRTYHSLIAIVLALDSWLTSNLGGFFIGMLISVIGGSLAFGWMTDADYQSYGWIRPKTKVELPFRALQVVALLKAGRARLSEVRGPSAAPGPAELGALARLALRGAVSFASTMPGVLRELPAAYLRWRARGRTSVPVQEALFALPSDLEAGKPKIGWPLAGRKGHEPHGRAGVRAATAPAWSRRALAPWRRLLNR